MLPNEGLERDQIPKIEANIIVSFVDLVYKIQQIYFHKWQTDLHPDDVAASEQGIS